MNSSTREERKTWKERPMSHPEETLANKDVPEGMWNDVAKVPFIRTRDDFRSWLREWDNVEFWHNNTLTNALSEGISHSRVYALFLSYLYSACSRQRFRSMLRHFFLQHLSGRRTYLEAVLLYVPYRELFPFGEDVSLPNSFLNGKHDNNLTLLLEHGYPSDRRVESGETPLQCAIAYESVFTIRLLMRYGTNVNHRDMSGRTLLQLACEEGKFMSVKLLLTCGANVHAISVDGYSVLYYALQSMKAEIVVLLLQHGCAVNYHDRHGNHILDWLTEMPRQVINVMLPLLLRAGAQPEYAREVSRRHLLLL